MAAFHYGGMAASMPLRRSRVKSKIISVPDQQIVTDAHPEKADCRSGKQRSGTSGLIRAAVSRARVPTLKVLAGKDSIANLTPGSRAVGLQHFGDRRIARSQPV
jgi:hypothetical protein